MLVVYGDSDPFGPGAWTDTALDAACVGRYHHDPERPTQPQPDPAETLAWIGDRFRIGARPERL